MVQMNIRIIWTPCLQTGCFPTVNHMCICVIYIYVLCMNDKLTCVLCVLNAHRTQTVIESEKQNTHCYCAFVCSQIRCSGYSCSSRSKTQYTHSIHSQIAYKQAEHNNKPSSCMYCACVCNAVVAPSSACIQYSVNARHLCKVHHSLMRVK